MPLQVKVTGQPAAGFSVESITQVPDQVTVYAPEDVLNKLEFYEGLQIDLTGLKESKKMTMDIPLKNKATQVTPNKVEVSISVVPSTVKVVDNVPITLVGDNPGFTAKLVTPDTGKVSIQLEGAPAILDKLKPQDVQAVADVSNLSPGRHELNITWNLPMFVKKPATDYKAVVEVTGGGIPHRARRLSPVLRQ
ncbi:CdaR family protein [Paenibacillus sp. CC-CFT747]|nr:CdaR family protein [Paenibacillus sp. CC-CFT747]